MLLADRRYRWTGRLTAGLGAYVAALAMLVVLLSGDVGSSRTWFFLVAGLGAVILGTVVVRVRRLPARPRR